VLRRRRSADHDGWRYSMGEIGKGKDKGSTKKVAKPRKGGLRPHEQRAQTTLGTAPRT